MTYPEFMPVFTSDDILLSETEYEDGDKRTTVGWLKHLFLFQHKADDYIWIDEQDRKIYKTVLDKFRKCCKIGAKDDLHQWEETNTAKHQAACLNALRKSLGYTVIVED